MEHSFEKCTIIDWRFIGDRTGRSVKAGRLLERLRYLILNTKAGSLYFATFLRSEPLTSLKRKRMELMLRIFFQDHRHCETILSKVL